MPNSPITPPPTARLLLKLFREFERSLLLAMSEQGFDDISSMHLNVVRHLDPQGMTMTNLAKDAAISKQAVGKIATDLIAKGYVYIDDSTSDRREKRVCYTPRGQKLVAHLVEQTKQMEKAYRIKLGAQRYEQLRESLRILIGEE